MNPMVVFDWLIQFKLWVWYFDSWPNCIKDPKSLSSPLLQTFILLELSRWDVTRQGETLLSRKPIPGWFSSFPSPTKHENIQTNKKYSNNVRDMLTSFLGAGWAVQWDGEWGREIQKFSFHAFLSSFARSVSYSNLGLVERCDHKSNNWLSQLARSGFV